MGMRQVDAARARIRYQLGGHEIEEEFFTAVEVWRVPAATFWYVNHILSFRGRLGKLDATTELFDVMVRSIKVNSQWKAAYERIITQLAQRQISHIRMISQIGRQYAQMGAEMREENLQSWYGKHETWDRLARERSEQIRDVETYWDPHKGMEVELPSQYEHAWVNSRGEYLVTHSANFNPNVDIDSALNWEPLQPVK